MRVLIFHGYLLRGTGSNVYNAALARGARARRPRGAPALPGPRPARAAWVDAAGDWDGGALRCATRREPVARDRLPARHRRAAAGLRRRPLRRHRGAPVRRAERRARSSDYVARNVAAVREVVGARAARRRAGQPPGDGPGDPRARARGTGVPYAVKIHGSALEYTVKPYPRFMPAAREGLAPRARDPRRLAPHRREPVGGAGRPGAVTAHAARPARRRRRPLRAARAGGRGRAGSSGCAAERLRGAPPPEAGRGLLVRALDRGGGRRARRARPGARPARGLRRQADRLQGRRAAAGGLAARARPASRTRGSDRRLRRLPRRARGPGRGARRAATSTPPRALRAEDGRELPELDARSSTRSAPRRPPTAAAAAGMTERDRTAPAGSTTSELADVLPAAEAIVVPSTFPEAFGMVAAEAAACGALPVVAGHSGLAEVAARARRGGARQARAVADLRGRPGAVTRARRRTSRAGSRRPRRCARRRARRSSAWRASATRGTASRRTVSRPPRAASTTSRCPDPRGLRARLAPPRG